MMVFRPHITCKQCLFKAHQKPRHFFLGWKEWMGLLDHNELHRSPIQCKLPFKLCQVLLNTSNKLGQCPTALHLPGSTLQLVPWVPRIVLGEEERDGAFVVVVAQKGFHPWDINTVSVSECMPTGFVVLKLTLNNIFFKKHILICNWMFVFAVVSHREITATLGKHEITSSEVKEMYWSYLVYEFKHFSPNKPTLGCFIIPKLCMLYLADFCAGWQEPEGPVEPLYWTTIDHCIKVC